MTTSSTPSSELFKPSGRTNVNAQSEIGADELTRRTLHQEFVNALTHGCGLVLSLLAAPLLLAAAIIHGDAWLILGCGAYTVSLVPVYAASTLSHCVHRPQSKQLFRMWDQGLIYLLIAGTYTPFALAYLRSGWWWLLVVV